MSDEHKVKTDHPIHRMISGRWSPYAYGDRPVSGEDLRSLFEAARWAPSCFNEQPWRYLVADRSTSAEEYDKLLSCLNERNQEWARYAPVLAMGLVKRNFERNGKPNHHARHDLGLATANLCLEATARGLLVHQMAGILPERVRELFALPDDVEAVTGIAIGYYGDPATLSESRQKSDSKRRSRRPVREIVFAGEWGATAPFLR